MAFESLAALFAMGGHAPYVWSAWGVAALLLVGSVVHAHAERRRLMRDLLRRNRRERNLSERETHDT